MCMQDLKIGQEIRPRIIYSTINAVADVPIPANPNRVALSVTAGQLVNVMVGPTAANNPIAIGVGMGGDYGFWMLHQRDVGLLVCDSFTITANGEAGGALVVREYVLSPALDRAVQQTPI